MANQSNEQAKRWRYTQALRKAHRNGELTEGQVARLEKAGFVFEPKPSKRAVICFETGEVFESIRAAAKRMNIPAANLSTSLRKRTKAGAYHWYYADEPKPSLSEFKKVRARGVVCYETGELFESVKAAAKAVGLRSKSAVASAIGRRGEAGGYHWYWADEPKPDPSELVKTHVRLVVCYETGEVFESCNAAAEAIGIKDANRIRTAVYGKTTCEGYHWYYADEPKPDPGALKRKGRAVICYETGEVFESITAAAKAVGLKCVGNVSAAIISKTTTGGFHWYWADEPKPYPSGFAKPNKRVVVCCETGEVFKSIKAAAGEAGVAPSTVSGAIRRKGIAGGFHWRYATEEEVAQLLNEARNDLANARTI